MKKLLLLLAGFVLLTGCNNNYIEITPKQAYDMIKEDNKILIVDVRDKSEYNVGHLKNAISIPLNNIENIKKEISDKNKKIILYCYSGKRAKEAAIKLIDMGYKNVYTFGGIKDWKYEVVI